MSSWRDHVSERAQAELDGLLGAVVPFAKEMLGEHGEYYPYGAILTLDDEVRFVAGDPGTGDHPDPTEVLDVLYATLAEAGPESAATAAVSDVKLIEPPTDAIRVELEHREGVAITVVLAYELLGEPGDDAALLITDVTAVQGERRTWPDSLT